MASEIPAAVIQPVPGPEPARAIPATGEAIAEEIRSRHAPAVEKFDRLKAVRSVTVPRCEFGAQERVS